jgi:hypothetical protein
LALHPGVVMCKPRDEDVVSSRLKPCAASYIQCALKREVEDTAKCFEQWIDSQEPNNAAWFDEIEDYLEWQGFAVVEQFIYREQHGLEVR